MRFLDPWTSVERPDLDERSRRYGLVRSTAAEFDALRRWPPQVLETARILGASSVQRPPVRGLDVGVSMIADSESVPHNGLRVDPLALEGLATRVAERGTACGPSC